METRVLRGGAWNNNQRNARSAYRNDNHPDNRNDNIGFRVAVSHDSHEPPEMRLGR
jgi:formylglycine-generating enzyme required for sulfatase activity